MDASILEEYLHEHGHVHAFLDSGAEMSLCMGDVTIDRSGYLEIDSKEDHIIFPAEKIEYIDVEPSEKEAGA